MSLNMSQLCFLNQCVNVCAKYMISECPNSKFVCNKCQLLILRKNYIAKWAQLSFIVLKILTAFV